MVDGLIAADADAAAGLSASFGWPHRVEDWAMFLAVGHGVGWREGGRLVGTAMWFPLDDGRASIGLVQVSGALQGRGIGRRLMHAVMAAAAPRALALHATAEGAALYASLGFVPAGVVQQWQGVFVPSTGCAGQARTATPDDRAAMLHLDRAATGIDRGALLDVWLGAASVSVTDTGYAARRRFGRGALIGPLVACDLADAIALIEHLAEPGFLRMDLSDTAGGLHAWLQAHGLTCVDRVRRMVRGDWPEPRHWGLMTQALG